MEQKAAADRLEMEQKAAADRLEMERKAEADRLDLERKMAVMERKLAEERRESEKSMKKFDNARMKSEAQRKEISRLRLQLPDDQHTQIVQHYHCAPYDHYEHEQHRTREC